MSQGNIDGKCEFLKQVEVQDFIEWFRGLLSGNEFKHRYLCKKPKSVWQCSSLFDAFKKYHWQFSYRNSFKRKISGSTYHESEKSLSFLQKELHESLAQMNEERCLKVCCMILEWGGVLGSDKKGNKKRLNNWNGSFCKYLLEVKEYFNSTEVKLATSYSVDIDGESEPIVMNAGFTKIYSLLCHNFIIYDGRVGAALGLLVRKYCETKTNQGKVPEPLQFYYGKAKGTQDRNPSKGIYKFKALSTPAVHVRNNLKANWILTAALKGESDFSQLRDLEAALFMIGYDLSDSKDLTDNTLENYGQ